MEKFYGVIKLVESQCCKCVSEPAHNKHGCPILNDAIAELSPPELIEDEHGPRCTAFVPVEE